MGKKNPCFGCMKRKLLCHTFCKEGKEWAEWNAEQRRIRNEAKNNEYYSEFAKQATFRKIKEHRK
jgi:hypothetical protein